MGISEKPKKKNLSRKDLSRLGNDGIQDVPSVTLRRAARELKSGDPAEADRLWDFWRKNVK